MSPRPRFLSLPAERRSAILDAACAELSAHGFEKASTNRIIERAGVSKGALYYYFDDKRDLFLTTLRDANERGVEAVGPPREARDACGTSLVRSARNLVEITVEEVEAPESNLRWEDRR
jgi:AcrR family transcriptional regulator